MTRLRTLCALAAALFMVMALLQPAPVAAGEGRAGVVILVALAAQDAEDIDEVDADDSELEEDTDEVDDGVAEEAEGDIDEGELELSGNSVDDGEAEDDGDSVEDAEEHDGAVDEGESEEADDIDDSGFEEDGDVDDSELEEDGVDIDDSEVEEDGDSIDDGEVEDDAEEVDSNTVNDDDELEEDGDEGNDAEEAEEVDDDSIDDLIELLDDEIDDDDDAEEVDDRDVDGDGDPDVDDEEDDEDDPRENQAIVQLQPGVDPYEFASRYGASVLRTIPSANIVLLSIVFDEDNPVALGPLFADPDVMWGELNYTSQAPEGRPRYFFSGTVGEPQLVDAAALPQGLAFSPDASCATGESVIVAVLDTGVDANHPALAGNILPNGYNAVDDTHDVTDVGNGVDDDNDGQVDEMVGHGTHVTGTILQVAPDAVILPVKVLNSDGVGDAFYVTYGIFYAAEQDADVINLSLGSTFASRAVQTAVEHAASLGIAVVAAAGNSNQEQPVEYPAAVDSVISVAATDANGDKAVFSNYNTNVDISAPGVDVASSHPDGRYSTASGTSMSAAIVTGTVALLLELYPETSVDEVEAILESSSDPLQPSDPAHDGKLGAGELNIDAAIACGG